MKTDAERRAREAFEDEVIDRLFVLNGKGAEEERRLGLAASVKGKGKGKNSSSDPFAPSRGA